MQTKREKQLNRKQAKRGKKSKRRPRSERTKPERGPNLPAVTDETTGSAGEGEAVLASPHIRRDLRTFREYMRAGVFTEKQIDGMTSMIGGIIAQGDNREKIAAFKTLLVRAKLEYDIERESLAGRTERTEHVHRHGHIHVDANGIGGDLARIASEVGITIDIVPDGGGATDDKIIEGQSGRSQQEDG